MKKMPVVFFMLMIVAVAHSQKWNYDVAKTVTNVKGTVKYLEDKETVVIIPDEKASGRYIAVNLPGEYKAEGLKVTFTGYVGKIPPNYRMMGTPLKLKSICISKAEQKKFKLKKKKYSFK